MRILFLIPYPLGEAPSQRFRFEQYFELLKNNGFSYSVQPFLSRSNGKVFYRRGNLLKKSMALLAGFARRAKVIALAGEFDFVFIHREAAPIGPPLFEWVLAVIMKKRLIYDFDDAIWMTDQTDESPLQRTVKWRAKVSQICGWSYKISCGNHYLCSYARAFNPAVVYNPTTLETTSMHVPSRKNSKDSVVIGWTGSHSTLKYLVSLEKVLAQLAAEYPNLRIRVIADRKPPLDVPRIDFVPWNKESEIEDLNGIDIGIMPLPDDEWSKGKCGFKALQYMALEIPAVAAAVGVNSSIIDHGVNGFLASSEEEWIQHLRLLIVNPELRQQLGRAGRQTVDCRFSVSANSETFLGLFS